MDDLTPAAELNDLEATIAALDDAAATNTPLLGHEPLTVEQFQAPLPVPTPAALPAEEPAVASEPAPAPSPAPTPADDEPPAPVLHPSAKTALPEGMPRNFRLAAQDEAEALAFQIRKSNPNMHMREALAQAEKQLGIAPAPAASPAAPAAPEPPAAPADPVAVINGKIATLEAELADLNPAFDATEWKDKSLEIARLGREQATLIAKQEALAVLQQQQQIQQEIQTAEQQFAAVAAHFTDLQDENSAFAREFARLHNANIASNSPLLEDANYERTLAAQVAGAFLLEGKPFTVKGAATTPTPSQPTPGSPPAAPAAPTAPRTAPAPAAMAPLPSALPTREHRVTVQPADPAANHEQRMYAAAAEGDLEATLRELDLSAGGQAPLTGLSFHSVSSTLQAAAA